MNMLPSLADDDLDQDHGEFLELALALAGAPPSRMLAALEAVRSHAAAHFSREDSDLRGLGGNNADCHIAEHAAVLKSLDEVLGSLRAQPPAEGVPQMIQALSDELLRWLPHHVGEMDAELAAARARARFGGAVIRFAPPRQAQTAGSL
ncbi:MAG TPA: hemerythrin family protein [Chitinolyticbacter sp.]|nr:hemerythrin family protein [Chitinolyticbacter sp.]